MDGTFTDIFNSSDIEVISDIEVTNTIPIEEIKPSVIASNVVKEEAINKKSKPKSKMDKVLLIQLILLATWGILTTLIYFFGYDIFSQFIDISQ